MDVLTLEKQMPYRKIILYARNSHEAKYQLLINKREITGLKYLNDSKASIEFSSDMDDIYQNIEE